jgi:hypothetical protein
VVAADERPPVELALAEQRALVRAEAVVGAERPAGADDDEVDAARVERERAVAREVGDGGEANPAAGLGRGCGDRGQGAIVRPRPAGG